MSNYNDVNRVELACNRITIKIPVKILLEGGRKTLQTSTITVSDTRQYAYCWKENIILCNTVKMDLLIYLCTLKTGLPFD